MIIKNSITTRTQIKGWSEHQSAPFLLQSPKSYFATKFFLLTGIVIQRIILLANNKDYSALNIIQIAGLPLLFLSEGILFYFTRRNKVSNGVTCLIFGLFQIIIMEFFIGLTMPIVKDSDNGNQVFVLQQEILLVCVHAIMFIDLFFVRIGLLFYAFLTFLFRLSPDLGGKYYAGWSVMMASLIVSFFVVVLSNSHLKGDQQKKSDTFDQFENISHGLAILTPGKEVIFMNNFFKTLTETDNEKHALDKVFQMKDFHSYSERDQSAMINRIHVRTYDLFVGEDNLENLPNAEFFNLKRNTYNNSEDYEQINVQVEGQEANDSPESAIDKLISSLIDENVFKQRKGMSPFEAREKLVKRLKSKKINNEYTQLIASEKSQRIQIVVRPSKDVRVLEMILVPFWDDTNPLLFVYLKDITMEMKVVSVVQRHDKELLSLTSAHHEIRAPVNAICYLLELLNTDASAEGYSKYAVPALSCVGHLRYILYSLLDFDSMNRKRFRLNIESHQLKKIFNEVIFMMSLPCERKNLELKLEWDSRVPRKYFTDANRVKQVLFNLVSNAMKFTMRGSITVRVAYISDFRCKVEVIDTGIGIKHEDLERLKRDMGKDSCIDRSRYPRSRAGMGLMTLNCFLERLGPDKNEVQISSEYGVGSTFSFILESKRGEVLGRENSEPCDEENNNEEPQAHVPE